MTAPRGRRSTGPTYCKHPLPQGICAALVAADSPHPGVCTKHKEAP